MTTAISKNTTQVECVSWDANTETGVYRWAVANVTQLNRRNKLSSAIFLCPDPVQLPEPTPEETTVDTKSTPRYAFRIILLRGLANSSTSSSSGDDDDGPLAIFVEYVPEHNYSPGRQDCPGEKDEEKKSAAATITPPGATRIKCVVLQRTSDDTSSSNGCEVKDEGKAEDTAEYSLQRRAIGFRTFLSSHFLVLDGSSPFIEVVHGAQNSNTQESGATGVSTTGNMIVEVTIKLHANLLKDEVLRTTEAVKTSLWKGAAGVLGWASTAITKAQKTAVEVGSAVKNSASETFHEVSTRRSDVLSSFDAATNRKERQQEGFDGTSAVEGSTSTPWQHCPNKWRIRASHQEWTKLVRDTLPLNEATFLSGISADEADEQGSNASASSSQYFSSEEKLQLSQVGLSVRTIVACAREFNYDNDVEQCLVTQSPALRSAHTRLVPGTVDDVHFWRNYFWRVNVLAVCTSSEQVSLFLTIVNAPDRKDTSRGILTTAQQHTAARARSEKELAATVASTADALMHETTDSLGDNAVASFFTFLTDSDLKDIETAVLNCQKVSGLLGGMIEDGMREETADKVFMAAVKSAAKARKHTQTLKAFLLNRVKVQAQERGIYTTPVKRASTVVAEAGPHTDANDALETYEESVLRRVPYQGALESCAGKCLLQILDEAEGMVIVALRSAKTAAMAEDDSVFLAKLPVKEANANEQAVVAREHSHVDEPPAAKGSQEENTTKKDVVEKNQRVSDDDASDPSSFDVIDESADADAASKNAHAIGQQHADPSVTARVAIETTDRQKRSATPRSETQGKVLMPWEEDDDE